MANLTKLLKEPSLILERLTKLFSDTAAEGFSARAMLKTFRGGLLIVLGFLLSPLSWWNDLFFNLPIAYGFGYLCSWVSPHLFMPASIAGYWVSNIIGILLMQAGLADMLQGKSKEQNLKKELLTGVLSSTAYTLLIVGLIQFKILEAPTWIVGG